MRLFLFTAVKLCLSAGALPARDIHRLDIQIVFLHRYDAAEIPSLLENLRELNQPRLLNVPVVPESFEYPCYAVAVVYWICASDLVSEHRWPKIHPTGIKIAPGGVYAADELFLINRRGVHAIQCSVFSTPGRIFSF